jgi:sulfur carrier protein ThiS
MATIAFTPNLRRHLDAESARVPVGTVRSALESVFSTNQRLRSYILDDQGALRQHVVVFIDGRRVTDRARLTDVVDEESEIYVMQALSGG